MIVLVFAVAQPLQMIVVKMFDVSTTGFFRRVMGVGGDYSYHNFFYTRGGGIQSKTKKIFFVLGGYSPPTT